MNIKDPTSFPFAHPVYVRSILDCLNSRGVPPATVIANAGLAWSDLCDGEQMVEFPVFRRFVAHAIRCSGDPQLGLLAGSMLQPYHTPVWIGSVTSENLGQGLEFLSRYGKLIFGGMDFELELGPRWSTFKVRPRRALYETHVFVMQSILVAHCRLLEAILGRPVEELSVGLPYHRPAGNDISCSRYVRRLEFDQECLSFQLPVGLLRARSACSDEKAFAGAAKICQKLESELGHGAFVQRVQQALLERLTTNPEVKELALDLGISSRTLVRRLAEAKVTFSDIKDELRKANAAWYLEHTEMPIEAIATQLGYADRTNFTRKFKYWYHVTPSKMRQTLRIDLAWANRTDQAR